MTKREKLIELWYKLQTAIKENPLNSESARGIRMNHYRKGEGVVDIQNAAQKMWEDYDNYDKPRKEIQAKIDELIEIHNPKVIDIHKDVDDEWFGVYVNDEEAEFSAWLDVCIDEEHRDIEVDWNQYIFHLYDEDDIYQKLHQENDMVFDYFSSEAVCALETEGYIYQDDDGNWYKGGVK